MRRELGGTDRVSRRAAKVPPFRGSATCPTARVDDGLPSGSGSAACVESALQVTQAPALALQLADDHVEAHPAPAAAAVLVQPGRRAAHQPDLLAGVDRELRRA